MTGTPAPHAPLAPLVGTERIEAFSDGVLAIIITIMVLELRPSADPSINVLTELIPTFITYAMSFIYLGIYWNNHHHLMRASSVVTGGVMWANLHLLFWLSLVPFITGWMGRTNFAALPVGVYGVILLLAAISFTILQRTLIAAAGSDSAVARGTGNDRKGKLSLLLYTAAVGLAFVDRRISGAIYVLVAFIWLIPDRRMVRALQQAQAEPDA